MTTYLTLIEAGAIHTTADRLRQHWRKIFISTFPTICNKRGPPCTLESEPKRRRVGVKAVARIYLEGAEKDGVLDAKEISKVEEMSEASEMLEVDAMSEPDSMSISSRFSEEDVVNIRVVEMGDVYEVEDIEDETSMGMEESLTPAIVRLQPKITAATSTSVPTINKDQDEEVKDGKMDPRLRDVELEDQYESSMLTASTNLLCFTINDS